MRTAEAVIDIVKFLYLGQFKAVMDSNMSHGFSLDQRQSWIYQLELLSPNKPPLTLTKTWSPMRRQSLILSNILGSCWKLHKFCLAYRWLWMFGSTKTSGCLLRSSHWYCQIVTCGHGWSREYARNRAMHEPFDKYPLVNLIPQRHFFLISSKCYI